LAGEAAVTVQPDPKHPLRADAPPRRIGDFVYSPQRVRPGGRPRLGAGKDGRTRFWSEGGARSSVRRRRGCGARRCADTQRPLSGEAGPPLGDLSRSLLAFLPGPCKSGRVAIIYSRAFIRPCISRVNGRFMWSPVSLPGLGGSFCARAAFGGPLIIRPGSVIYRGCPCGPRPSLFSRRAFVLSFLPAGNRPDPGRG
jgi:hypothetical protein